MKLRIKSMFWNIGKQKTTNQNKKKKQSKKMRIVKAASGKTSNVQTFASQTCQVEKRKIKKLEMFEKIMKENFPNLVKDTCKSRKHRVPNKMDANRSTPRHFIIKMPKVKDKERILKAPREKKLVIYRGVPTRLSADFSKETLQARRDWQEISNVMKGGDIQPRLLYSERYHLELKGR